MQFQITDVEVSKKRNKIGSPCHDWENYDDTILTQHIKRTGCRAPYHGNMLGGELCSSKELMKNVAYNIPRLDHGILSPCKTMEKINFKYLETDMLGFKGYLAIAISYLDENTE